MTGGTKVPTKPAPGTSHRARVFYFNGGFFTQIQVRRILDLAGFDLTLGKPGPEDQIAVWGKSPTSGRGEKVGELTGAQLIHVEDAFLRSIKSGRTGEPPLGLTIDHQRPYFDSSGPSDLESLLVTSPLDDAALLNRARDAIARLQDLHLSKYNDFDLDLPEPEPGYVLVLDQTRDDASITYGGGSVAAFREMLVFAQQDHPGARILIKSHPDTVAGFRDGHFGPEHLNERMELVTARYSPQQLFAGAIAVYTVSSGMGFEAILAGHKPVVFGQPFYAGWGLTEDHQPIDRRQRRLTRAQLFAGAMMLYPKWYDPYRDRLCEIEQVIDTLEAQCRAEAEDQAGYVALNMSRWKHPHLREFFGQKQALVFEPPDEPDERPLLSWASKSDGLTRLATSPPLFRVEDGFLRSRGLGASLIPPLSLVKDGQGIYYDPNAPSDLEDLINDSPTLPEYAISRVTKLRRKIIKHGVSKYNLPASEMDFDAGEREVILVPGQVEDDASIRFGTGTITTNRALLEAVRRDYPEALILFKPHPDVAAGLRQGETPDGADMILNDGDASAALAECDRVATMTSLLGFEALLRGLPVTCYGLPFYAGWGLTDDRMTAPARRMARPTIDQLAHAALIDYPRYFDPKTKQPCPPEVAVERLISGEIPQPAPSNRLLSKLQRAFSRFAPFWRR
ncbi:MAG: capsular polysaccharide biosynthesis protein [Pseudomonadota bacterium]